MKLMRIRHNRPAFLWTLATAAAVAVMLFFSSDLSAQCAMCRTALTQSPEGLRWSRGINAGILMLLAAPFLIAGCGLAVIYQAQLLGWLRKMRMRLAPGGAYRRAELIAPPISER